MDSTERFQSQVVIRNQYPGDQLNRDTHVLLYDHSLMEGTDELIDFIESFPHRLAVRGGEALKSFRDFPKNFEALLKVWPEPVNRSQTLVVLGGGSLGDFGGFVASILKRGVRLVQIPTTWVAAMDSAHGGKNGLNLVGVKNQVGTFYPADKVFIIKDILQNTPEELKEEGFGELIKMALIGPSKFFKEIIMEKRQGADFSWRFLRFCIEDKYDFILQDPYETKKIRQTLNFGHSFGHALEAHFSWPHGDSVLQGIFFALEWSRYRGHLSQSRYDEILQVIAEKFDRVPAHQLKWYRAPGKKSIEKLLLQDKKIAGDGKILYVFLKNIGQPLLKSIAVKDLISEAKRQGWIK